jgi:hypothetical protein
MSLTPIDPTQANSISPNMKVSQERAPSSISHIGHITDVSPIEESYRNSDLDSQPSTPIKKKPLPPTAQVSMSITKIVGMLPKIKFKKSSSGRVAPSQDNQEVSQSNTPSQQDKVAETKVKKSRLPFQKAKIAPEADISLDEFPSQVLQKKPEKTKVKTKFSFKAKKLLPKKSTDASSPSQSKNTSNNSPTKIFERSSSKEAPFRTSETAERNNPRTSIEKKSSLPLEVNTTLYTDEHITSLANSVNQVGVKGILKNEVKELLKDIKNFGSGGLRDAVNKTGGEYFNTEYQGEYDKTKDGGKGAKFPERCSVAAYKVASTPFTGIFAAVKTGVVVGRSVNQARETKKKEGISYKDQFKNIDKEALTREFCRSCVRGGATATAAIAAASIVFGGGVPLIVYAGVATVGFGLLARPAFETMTLNQALEQRDDLSNEEKNQLRAAVLTGVCVEMGADVVTSAAEGFAFGMFCTGVLAAPITERGIGIATMTANAHTGIDNLTPTGDVIEKTEVQMQTERVFFFQDCSLEFRKDPQIMINRLIEQAPHYEQISEEINNLKEVEREEIFDQISTVINQGHSLSYALSVYDLQGDFEGVKESESIKKSSFFNTSKESWKNLTQLSPKEKFTSCALRIKAEQFESSPKAMLSDLATPPSQEFIDSLTSENIDSIKDQLLQGFSLYDIVAALQSPQMQLNPLDQITTPEQFDDKANDWNSINSLDEDDTEVAYINSEDIALIPNTTPRGTTPTAVPIANAPTSNAQPLLKIDVSDHQDALKNLPPSPSSPSIRKSPTKNSKLIFSRGAEINDALYNSNNSLSAKEKSALKLEFQGLLNDYLNEMPPTN